LHDISVALRVGEGWTDYASDEDKANALYALVVRVFTGWCGIVQASSGFDCGLLCLNF